MGGGRLDPNVPSVRGIARLEHAPTDELLRAPSRALAPAHFSCGGCRREIPLGATERTRDPKHERDQERHGADHRVNEADVARPFDEEADGASAEGLR